MDDHTFFLVRQVEDQIRRTELLIEQQRLHIMSLHPSRRRNDEIKLKSLMSDYTRLLNYRLCPRYTAPPSQRTTKPSASPETSITCHDGG